MEGEPGQVARDDDQSWRMWPWGCLGASALLVLIVYGIYRFAISLGVAWSAGG